MLHKRHVFGEVGNSLWNVVCMVFDGTNIPLIVPGLFFITPSSSLFHSCQLCVSLLSVREV